MNAYEQGDDVMLDVACYDHLWVNGFSDLTTPPGLAATPWG